MNILFLTMQPHMIGKMFNLLLAPYGKFSVGLSSTFLPHFAFCRRFDEIEVKVLGMISRELKNKPNNDEPLPVKQARMMYKSCMNTTYTDKLGLEELFHFLELFNLPKIPTLITKPDVEDFKFDWIKSIVKIKKSLGVDKFLGFGVYADVKNRSVNYLTFVWPEQANDLDLPL